MSTLLESIAKAYEKEAKLSKAITNRNVKTVRTLLEQKANVHIQNDCFLRDCISDMFPPLDIIKTLLEHKSNVHIQNDYPLRKSSEKGHIDIVRILLEFNADVHASHDYALRIACRLGHTDIVQLLLDHQANLRALDNYALRYASLYGYTQIVKLLLKHGAYDTPDSTALQWACKNGHSETVRVLTFHRKLIELLNLYRRVSEHERTTGTQLFHRRDILYTILQF